MQGVFDHPQHSANFVVERLPRIFGEPEGWEQFGRNTDVWPAVDLDGELHEGARALRDDGRSVSGGDPSSNVGQSDFTGEDPNHIGSFIAVKLCRMAQ